MATLLLSVGGLAVLVAGAASLVRGESKLALRLGWLPLVVGLTVVVGTSAPEMAVSTGAVLTERSGLAVGSAVGSKIFNVLFILGVAALITPRDWRSCRIGLDVGPVLPQGQLSARFALPIFLFRSTSETLGRVDPICWTLEALSARSLARSAERFHATEP